MKIISVNTGLPREIFHEGRMIRTSIFKSPVAARVRMTALNIEGDRQADLTVHGGPTKALRLSSGTLHLLAPGAG
jgi:MOSC domain-containing protein YiiM